MSQQPYICSILSLTLLFQHDNHYRDVGRAPESEEKAIHNHSAYGTTNREAPCHGSLVGGFSSQLRLWLPPPAATARSGTHTPNMREVIVKAIILAQWQSLHIYLHLAMCQLVCRDFDLHQTSTVTTAVENRSWFATLRPQNDRRLDVTAGSVRPQASFARIVVLSGARHVNPESTSMAGTGTLNDWYRVGHAKIR